MFSCSLIISRFAGLSTVCQGFFTISACPPPGQAAVVKRGASSYRALKENQGLLIAVPLRGVAIDAALEQLAAVELQQPAARDLVKGNQSPPGVHPDSPDLLLPFFFLSQGHPSRLVVCPSFYAIFV